MAFKFIKHKQDPKKRRPEKEEYYMSIAKQIAQRSTCLKRRYGAVIVKEDNIVAAGYIGSPRGTPNCIDLSTCSHEKNQRTNQSNNQQNIAQNNQQDDRLSCRGVHAEINAIINAARAGTSVLGGVMYLYGEDALTGSVIFGKPCKFCRKIIVNAGISEVIVLGEKSFKKYRAEFWVKESQKDPFADTFEK